MSRGLDAARIFTPTLAPDTIVVFQGRNEMTASPNLSFAPISFGMDGLVAFPLGQCDVSGVSRWGAHLHLHFTFLTLALTLAPQLFLPASFLAEALTRGREGVQGGLGGRGRAYFARACDRTTREQNKMRDPFLSRLMREGSCLAIRTQNTSTCMHACSPIQTKLCLLLFLYRSPPALHTKLLMCCSGAGLV